MANCSALVASYSSTRYLVTQSFSLWVSNTASLIREVSTRSQEKNTTSRYLFPSCTECPSRSRFLIRDTQSLKSAESSDLYTSTPDDPVEMRIAGVPHTTRPVGFIAALVAGLVRADVDPLDTRDQHYTENHFA